MSIRLRERPSGLTAAALRTWGLVFLIVGAAGATIVQRGILNMNNINGEQLLQLLDNENLMIAATVALVCKALYCCAAPIFAFLTVEGFLHTENYRKYLLSVLGVALVSELPFNFAMSGKLIDVSSRNPCFGLALALVMLYYYNSYEAGGFKGFMIKLFVTAAAFLWAAIFKVDDGMSLLLMTVALWIFRNRTTLRGFACGAASFVCCIFTPFYLAAPMALLTVHFYNGERGEQNKLLNYLAFPVILLILGIFTEAVRDLALFA